MRLGLLACVLLAPLPSLKLQQFSERLSERPPLLPTTPGACLDTHPLNLSPLPPHHPQQVADSQLAIAIRGECAVPRIMLSKPVLEFGECYVRHPYKWVGEAWPDLRAAEVAG